MSMAYPRITHCSECGKKLDGWLGRCESCQQVNSSVNKYKLIDVLVMISKGELKEGTKIEWDGVEYTYFKYNGHDEIYSEEYGAYLWNDMYWGNLNEECELIEPTDNTTEKIEELDILEMGDSQNIDNLGLANSIVDLRNAIRETQHKLNEVINELNRRINNVR